MKTVGVISIFKTGNYGATLQAFALMEAINKNGYAKAETINYCCDAIKGKIDLKYVKKAGIAKSIAAIIDQMICYPRMKKVNKFIASYVKGRELKKEELPLLNEKYDIFLAGSDQLWNPDVQQNDYFYLLDFVDDESKKISYASSFGKKELAEQYKDTYIKLLSGFKTITVREKAGSDIVYNLLGKRPEVVLDPTFLLSAEQWESMLPNRIKAEKYVFTYRMSYSKLLSEVVKVAQKEMKIKVMAIPFLLGRCPKTQNFLTLSSLEWLRGIYDSEFVITDSFHCVVFSIIFSKQFYYVVTTATVRERISRLETLLEELEIKNRIVESAADCNFEDIIDYEKVQKNLVIKRNKDLNILEEMIKG